MECGQRPVAGLPQAEGSLRERPAPGEIARGSRHVTASPSYIHAAAPAMHAPVHQPAAAAPSQHHHNAGLVQAPRQPARHLPGPAPCHAARTAAGAEPRHVRNLLLEKKMRALGQSTPQCKCGRALTPPVILQHPQPHLHPLRPPLDAQGHLPAQRPRHRRLRRRLLRRHPPHPVRLLPAPARRAHQGPEPGH